MLCLSRRPPKGPRVESKDCRFFSPALDLDLALCLCVWPGLQGVYMRMLTPFQSRDCEMPFCDFSRFSAGRLRQ